MTDFTTITACGECCVGCSKKIDGSCPGCIEADGRVPEWAGSGRCKVHACAREHGDNTACQLICGEDSIKAVIDFSSVRCIPAVWEIMRSYIQSGGVSRDNSSFDIEDFTLYVKEYMKYAPLTKRDLEAMPYIYLFQLAQSSYGYKEYLITKTENKEALLDFGFWRTGICRDIYQKASAISAALLNIENG